MKISEEFNSIVMDVEGNSFPTMWSGKDGEYSANIELISPYNVSSLRYFWILKKNGLMIRQGITNSLEKSVETINRLINTDRNIEKI